MQRERGGRKKPLALASVAFQIPGRKTAAEYHGVFLYKY